MAETHFDNKVYSDNLLRSYKLINIPVNVTAHREIIHSGCVIRCEELGDIGEEDIKY